MRRRTFLRCAAACAALPAARLGAAMTRKDEPVFRISLAQWSLHRAFFAGALDAQDFPVIAQRDYGIDAVEYVNSFFKDRARDEAWLGAMKAKAEDRGVRSLLIMVDGEGAVGDADAAARAQAIENHVRWLDAAKFLGCHSIRVNAQSSGSREEQAARAADGLRRLVEHAEPRGLNVLVENHGGLSSDGSWLADVMRRVDHPRCGTLPDFGNFHLGDDRWYDRYRGVGELMPFAKAVSAKSHDFDDAGDETGTDYRRMLGIVLDAGYRGWIGVEYEGERLPEPEGIRRTKALLERLRAEIGATAAPATSDR